ncbi:MAG: glycosyltransferase family 39 protein, partial [Desulfobacterales bacterium]|nr:glycosyltransferase family 39 protein [Desulfobacterales bacterium]
MKKAIILLYIVLIASKFVLASHLDLFGDEAFYWQCAQRPSFSYIDHPPLTAMLVRAGTQILGDVPLGVRFFFLICGAIFPIAIYGLMRPLAGDRNSWLAAGASMVFPGTAYLGLVAIPDVPMLLIMVLSVMCFERATREGLMRFWVLAGICGAVGFLTHYRFILLPLAAFLYLTLTSNGRSYLREKGPWVTGALLLSGLVPVLIFNLQTDFEPVRYYLSGRHALSFSFEKLLQFVLEQVLMATPFFFIAMMGSMALL